MKGIFRPFPLRHIQERTGDEIDVSVFVTHNLAAGFDPDDFSVFSANPIFANVALVVSGRNEFLPRMGAVLFQNEIKPREPA
jgi:hypothetical protein